MEKVIEINNKKYKLIKEHKDGFNKEVVESLLTEYFDNYDYVFGDWAYSKLRLKGFNKSDNKEVNNELFTSDLPFFLFFFFFFFFSSSYFSSSSSVSISY